jgi:predicted lipoprotein
MVATARSERLRPLLWVVPIVAVLVIFPPVRVRSLHASAVVQPARVSPQGFAATFWQQSLASSLGSAVDATELWRALREDPARAAQKFGRTSGIGARPVFLVRGNATVTKIDERGVWLDLGQPVDGATVLLSGPIFGNQVRDATGLIRIEDFDSFDFNAISAELNHLVETRVQPDLRKRASVGAHVTFAGAARLDDASEERAILKIVPIEVTWP